MIFSLLPTYFWEKFFWVSYPLKKRIKEDAAGPGVAPLAVVCISVDSISGFSEKWLSVYKYEVLGGQHTALARKDLLKENPANSFFKDVWAEVYVGLTSVEALRLGSRHNKNGHFIHKMTHRDYVVRRSLTLAEKRRVR